jgi:hypothetical protein
MMLEASDTGQERLETGLPHTVKLTLLFENAFGGTL